MAKEVTMYDLILKNGQKIEEVESLDCILDILEEKGWTVSEEGEYISKIEEKTVISPSGKSYAIHDKVKVAICDLYVPRVMKYADFKKHYHSCPTLKDSYDKGKKEITALLPMEMWDKI